MSIRLEPGLAGELERFAAASERTVSHAARYLLRLGLEAAGRSAGGPVQVDLEHATAAAAGRRRPAP